MRGEDAGGGDAGVRPQGLEKGGVAAGAHCGAQLRRHQAPAGRAGTLTGKEQAARDATRRRQEAAAKERPKSVVDRAGPDAADSDAADDGTGMPEGSWRRLGRAVRFMTLVMNVDRSVKESDLRAHVLGGVGVGGV